MAKLYFKYGAMGSSKTAQALTIPAPEPAILTLTA